MDFQSGLLVAIDTNFDTNLSLTKDLWVELKPNRPGYMVLKGTYGEKIHKTFRTTRQGVRWRFYRLFNHVYVEAFETILFLEKIFGTQLREYAVRVSRERYALRQKTVNGSFETVQDIFQK